MQKYKLDSYKFNRSLLFCWPTWVGKTYTARELLEKFHTDKANKLMTYEVSDVKFKQMVKSNILVMRKPQDRESGIFMYPLEVMLRCELLLYDDIGVSDVTESYLRDFTFIIDERANKWLPTIFTTNLTKKELEERLNVRIVSRILLNTDVVVFKWEDKRLDTTKYFEI